MLSDKDPLKSVESQTLDLQLKSNIVHPVTYISDSFTESQCGWPAITKECFWCFLCQLKMFLLLTKLTFISTFGPLLKIFTVNTSNEKCNTWGLEATTIPRDVKVQKH